MTNRDLRLGGRIRASRVGVYVAAIVTGVVMAFPLYGVVLTSLQREADVRSPDLSLIPRYLDFSHYQAVFNSNEIVPIIPAMVNSFIVSLVASFLAASLATPAAFALFRRHVPGGRILLSALVSIYVFPTMLFILPIYVLWIRLGLFDTRFGLIILYTAFILPIMIWILGSFIKAIPNEIEEAAQLDGAGTLTVLWKIIVPLVSPGLFAVLLLGFILSWVEFTTPLLLTSDLRITTVTLGLYRSTQDIQIGQLAAAAVLTALPVILLTVIFQRRITDVLVAGVSK